MPISSDFKSVHFKDFRVNFSQVMPNGFLKITELCNYLQLAAAEHSELGGISFLDMQMHNQAWVLSKMRLEIKKLPRWKDCVVVKTWIINLENSRSLRGMLVFVNDEIVATTETLWVVLNTIKRRPEALALPHNHFEKYALNFANSARVLKVDLSQNKKHIQNKKVVFSDLDLVNHVNHIKYLEWCADDLPPEKLLDNKIKVIDMNFMTELVLADEVKIETEINDKNQKFLVTKNDQNCFSMSIDFFD